MIRNAVAWAAPAVPEAVVLPVELGQFDVAVFPNHHELRWATFSELNNDHFIIQRRGELGDWSPIGIVRGAGTVNSKQQYHFTDEHPLIGTNYYRLKQIDFDGVYEYSEVIFSFHRPTANELTIYPNPSTDHFRVKGNVQHPIPLRIIDTSGKPLLSRTYHGDRVDISHLPTGLYYVRLGGQGGYY